jgi:hypothetical protein
LNRRTLNIALGLAIVSAVIFAIVAIEEFSYAATHPDAYGPAKNIAWGAVAGTLLSAAVALAVNAVRGDPHRTTQEPTPSERQTYTDA